jgi:hypothetical protein
MQGGLRRVLVRAVRYLVVQPSRLIVAVLLLLIVVASAVAIPLMTGFRFPSLGNVAVVSRATGEPESTATYMRGQREGNADLVWSAYSDEVRQALTQRGRTPAMTAQEFQAARQQGANVQEVSYVGGRQLPDGTSLQFYLVAMKAAQTGTVEYRPYLFTLDTTGKISRVQ